MITYYKVLYDFKIFKTNNKMLLNRRIRCYRFNNISIFIIHKLNVLKAVKTSRLDKILRNHIIYKKKYMYSFMYIVILLIANVYQLYYKGYQ